MKTKYLEIITLLSAVIVAEMISLHNEETHPSANADEMDDYIRLQREKCTNLQQIRDNIEAIAAGYSGSVRPPELKQDPIFAAADEIMKDVLRHGLSIRKISLADFFKEEPKTGAAPPPSENKAQSAAVAAAQAGNPAHGATTEL